MRKDAILHASYAFSEEVTHDLRPSKEAVREEGQVQPLRYKRDREDEECQVPRRPMPAEKDEHSDVLTASLVDHTRLSYMYDGKAFSTEGQKKCSTAEVTEPQAISGCP